MVWVFRVVLGGFLCEWWWVLEFCWVCSGDSMFFFFLIFLYGLWVVGDVGLASSSGEEEELLGRIERWERRERNRFFLYYLIV